MKVQITKFFKLLILGTLFILVTGCSESDEEKFTRLVSEAKAYKDQGKFNEARIQLLSASQIKPDSIEVYQYLSEVEIKLDQWNKAIGTLRTIINLDPRNRDARLALGTLSLYAGKALNAENHANEILKFKPDDISAKLLKANALSQQEREEDAQKIISELSKKYPDNPLVLSTLASNKVRTRDIKKAIELYKKAIEIDPRQTSSIIALTDILYISGNFKEAEKNLLELIKAKPDNTKLKFHYAEFLFKTGQYDKSQKYLSEVLKQDENNIYALNRLAQIYIQNKEVDKLKELYQTQKGTQNEDYLKARVLETQGKLKQALKKYQDSFITLPKFAPSYTRAGLLELALGLRTEGITHLKNALSYNEFDVDARLTLAKLAIREKNYAEARTHIDKVLSKNVAHMEANILKADLMLIDGNENQTREIYNSFTKLFPNSPIGYIKLGILEQRFQNNDAAIKNFKKAIKLDSNILLAGKMLSSLLVEKLGVLKTIEEFEKLKKDSNNSKAEFDQIIGALYLRNIASDSSSASQARKHLESALKQNPSLTEPYFLLANLTLKTESKKDAITYYEKFLEKSPNNVKALTILALIYEFIGNDTKAETLYRRIIGLNPSSTLALNNLAWLIGKKELKDYNEPIEYAQKAASLSPDSGYVLDTLGWLHFKNGATKLAISHLEDAASKTNYQQAEILSHLARVLFVDGRLEEANTTAKEALKLKSITKETNQVLRNLIKQIELATKAN